MENIKNEIIKKTAECVRRLRSPKKYKSLSFFCDYLGAGVQMNEKAKSISNKIVSQVCTINYTNFSKNNICLYYRNPVHGKLTLDDLKRAKDKGAAIFITDKPFV